MGKSEEKPAGQDEDRDLIMDESLARNEFPADRVKAALDEGSTCLALRVCTPELWEKHKGVTSKGAAKWTLARAINSGVRYPESKCGCHAGDMESYDDLEAFFLPVIKLYHLSFDPSKNFPFHEDTLNPDKISNDLSESSTQKVISSRIRVGRNLSMFPLNPAGTSKTRLDIASLMEKVYPDLPEDLAGTFLRHADMTEKQTQDLIDAHFLFRGRDKLQAASGYHQYWPDGRGIFLSKSRNFLNWVNEGDHLRLISMEMGADLRRVFSRLSAGAKAIEKLIQIKAGVQDVFMRHPKYGYITCCPTNLGTAMRASVHMKLPRLVTVFGLEKLDELAHQWHAQVRGTGGENSAIVGGVVDISNSRRLGLTEYELIEGMINAVNYFAKLEDIV